MGKEEFKNINYELCRQKDSIVKPHEGCECFTIKLNGTYGVIYSDLDFILKQLGYLRKVFEELYEDEEGMRKLQELQKCLL